MLSDKLPGPTSWGADVGALEITLARRFSKNELVYKSVSLHDKTALKAELGDLRHRVMPSVGSGSWRLSDEFEQQYGILIEKHREPVCIWSAIEYSLSLDESKTIGAYCYDHNRDVSSVSYPISAPYKETNRVESLKREVTFEELEQSFPILLVIVKTGTSFYRMDSPTEFVRVGGSSIGSSSLAALGKSLVSETSVRGMVNKAQQATRPSSVDLLVEDIYGGDCASIGLPGSIIASCLGKADEGSRDNTCDLSKSLLDMMSINTAQLTNLHAKIHKCTTALVIGPIFEEPEVSECMQRVLYILAGKEKTDVLKAVFFTNSKYLGCLGAMLRRETLVRQLSVRGSNIPIDTATVEDGVHDETYTKLRISTPQR
jgi:pantothenate kinase